MKAFLTLTLVIIWCSGCSFQFGRPDTGPQSARQNAALQLTLEGQRLLNAGKPDNAIRLFEQAVGLNPNDGQCYYYLAESWLAKGAKSEAREFNSLAKDYLKDDAEWANRVIQQEVRIRSMPK